MKQIVIYQENIAPILIEDDDSSNIEEFAANLSTLLEANNVSLLHTSRGSIVLRPNKIVSVVVYEVSSVGEVSEPQEIKKEQKDIQEDIITD